MRLQSMHLFQRYFPFFPLRLFHPSCKSNNFQESNFGLKLSWLIRKKIYIQELHTRNVCWNNSRLTLSSLTWPTQHYAYGGSIITGSKVWGEIHKHIFRSMYVFKRFILYFCTDLILLQEFIVRRYNLDSILSKIPNISSSKIFSEPYSIKEVPWLWRLSPSYATLFSMMNNQLF